MAHHSATARPLLGLALLVLAATALTGCGAMGSALGTSHTSLVYDSAADAHKGITTLPSISWIPEDATSVRVKYSSEGPGALMMVRSQTPADALKCTPAEAQPLPDLSESWWPTELPEKVHLCGSWAVFGINELLYASTTEKG